MGNTNRSATEGDNRKAKEKAVEPCKSRSQGEGLSREEVYERAVNTIVHRPNIKAVKSLLVTY